MPLDNLNDGKPVTERIYAWMILNKDDVEGILIVEAPGGGEFPLISTDLQAVRHMKEYVTRVAKATKQTVYLAAFNRAETIDIVDAPR